ncbi:hypothetical protein ZWY2020_045252 [Hordeum vulgare]|nr:hypothetical protein ZWY2020_045252 [Hordeum vulgare]
MKRYLCRLWRRRRQRAVQAPALPHSVQPRISSGGGADNNIPQYKVMYGVRRPAVWQAALAHGLAAQQPQPAAAGRLPELRCRSKEEEEGEGKGGSADGGSARWWWGGALHPAHAGAAVRDAGSHHRVDFGGLHTNGKAIFVHTILFFAAFTILTLALHIHIYAG